MRRLLMLAVVLIMLLTACAGSIVRAAQRDLVIAPSLTALHLTDCALPCWMGITPGVTTLEEARVQVEQVLSPLYIVFLDESTPNVLRFLLVDRADGKQLNLIVYITVNSISINFPAGSKLTRPTLAEIHNWLGVPQQVQRPQKVPTGEYAYILFYGNEHYRVAVYASSVERIALNEQITTLQISTQAQTPANGAVKAPLAITEPWQGFSSIFKYQVSGS
jgi:hypothetical protein